MQEKVYIILLNYKGWKDSIECIESLYKLTYTNYHIVLVDNASPNDSVAKICDWAEGKLKAEVANPALQQYVLPETAKPIVYNKLKENEVSNSFALQKEAKFTLIEATTNGGFSHGNNIGINFALAQKDAGFFWILNNDTIVTSDSLSELVKAYKERKDKKIGILGGKVKYYHLPDYIQCVGGASYNKWLAYGKQIANQQPDGPQYNDDSIQPDLIIGACMFVSTEFMQKVGLLGEDYFLYFEEQDWAERARRAGYTLGYTHKAVIYHKEGGSIGGNQLNIKGISTLSDFYYARNKIIFTKKFHNIFCIITVYLSFSLIILNRIRRWQPERIPMLIGILFNPKKHFENT